MAAANLPHRRNNENNAKRPDCSFHGPPPLVHPRGELRLILLCYGSCIPDAWLQTGNKQSKIQKRQDNFGKSNTVPIGRPRENIWHVAVMIRDMKKKGLGGMELGVNQASQAWLPGVNRIAQ